MSKYYFNIAFSGEFIPDRYGREFPDLAAAQSQALDMAQHILRVYGQHWREAELQIMRDRQKVATLRFSEL